MALRGQPTAEQFHAALNAAAVERDQLEADKQMWATMAADLLERVAELEAALRRIIDHKVKAGGHIVRIAEDALKGNRAEN